MNQQGHTNQQQPHAQDSDAEPGGPARPAITPAEQAARLMQAHHGRVAERLRRGGTLWGGEEGDDDELPASRHNLPGNEPNSSTSDTDALHGTGRKIAENSGKSPSEVGLSSTKRRRHSDRRQRETEPEMPSSTTDQTAYLTLAEAALRLRHSERWLRDNDAIARYRLGNRVYFKIADLDNYMELHRSGNSPDEEAARDGGQRPRGRRAADDQRRA